MEFSTEIDHKHAYKLFVKYSIVNTSTIKQFPLGPFPSPVSASKYKAGFYMVLIYSFANLCIQIWNTWK